MFTIKRATCVTKAGNSKNISFAILSPFFTHNQALNSRALAPACHALGSDNGV